MTGPSSLLGVAALTVLLVPEINWAAVSPDCFFGDLSITCALNRVDEAKDVDKIARPIFERRGWDWSCYEVQYVRGDNGGKDTILVAVKGVRGGKPPTCGERFDDGGRGAMSARDLSQVGKELKSALLAAPRPLREELFRKVKTVAVTNGWGGMAEIKL